MKKCFLIFELYMISNISFIKTTIFIKNLNYRYTYKEHSTILNKNIREYNNYRA